MSSILPKLDRRQFLATVAASASVLSVAGAAEAPRPRPNVLYVFSDQHRYQSMSFTEQPEMHTPNMARLAKEGVSFTHCISNYPVCSPHRAILMSGRWPYQTGVIDNGLPLSPNEHTLGKAFKNAGYKTGYIGKWHLGGVRAEPFGFDLSLVWTDTGRHWGKSQYHPAQGDPVTPKGYNATLMTDQALAFIDEHREEPFFLMLSLDPPHANFTDAPESKKALYPEGSLPYRPNVPKDAGNPSESEESVKKRYVDMDRFDWAAHQGYHAHISAVDEELGRLLKRLDDLALADNTIVVYTSDHGGMQGSHGLGSKRQPYEESIRVPYLLRYPDVVSPARREDALFGSIDIAPTLTSLAGLGPQSQFEGRDFSPLLRGEPFEKPQSQLIMHIAKDRASGGQEHPAPLFRGLRTPRHTYAELITGGGFLFDNHQDPYQLTNLFDDATQADLRQTLHQQLREALQHAHDPMAHP